MKVWQSFTILLNWQLVWCLNLTANKFDLILSIVSLYVILSYSIF